MDTERKEAPHDEDWLEVAEEHTENVVEEASSRLVDVERRIKHGVRKFGAVRRELKRRLGILDPLRIDVFVGHGHSQKLRLRGRALEDEVPRAPSRDDTAWSNLRRTLRQLETDEVPDLSVRVSVGDSHTTTCTDSEGYFDIDLELEQPLPPGWHDFKVDVVDDRFDGVGGQGRALVPEPNARFGVISDIDDTILQTHVGNRLRMAYVTLLGNAVTRLSYPETPELYRDLTSGRGPFFYVSKSAWNVHALLEQFLVAHEFPEGPLVLRDVTFVTPPDMRGGTKQQEIERILDTYPNLDFVLIGDSGQKDTEIYLDVSRRYPKRIVAVLIRDVAGPRKRKRKKRMLDEHRACPTLMFREAATARRWCRQWGLAST